MDVQLKVLHGKPRGHCLRFGPGEFVFGRGPECHVRPNSELVSRQHCMLKVQRNGALSVRDLGSANGTLVNGTLVIGELVLQNGDTLQLGPVVLQVLVSPSTSETAMVHLDQTTADMPAQG